MKRLILIVLFILCGCVTMPIKIEKSIKTQKPKSFEEQILAPFQKEKKLLIVAFELTPLFLPMRRFDIAKEIYDFYSTDKTANKMKFYDYIRIKLIGYSKFDKEGNYIQYYATREDIIEDYLKEVEKSYKLLEKMNETEDINVDIEKLKKENMKNEDK